MTVSLTMTIAFTIYCSSIMSVSRRLVGDDNFEDVSGKGRQTLLVKARIHAEPIYNMDIK